MPARPLVTIGVPVFNGERHLARALRSIADQTFEDFEAIVSDNCSTDGTEAICREFAARDARIRYHRATSNHGAGWNFNRTVELANGKYFKWMAHDDVIAPTFLERGVDPLERDESFVLCFPRRRFVLAGGVTVPDTTTVDLHDVGLVDLLRREGGSFPLMLFGVVRTNSLRRTRLLRSFRGSDIVILSELRLLGRFFQVPEVLFDQGVHEAVPRDRSSLRAEVRDFWARRGMKGLDRFPNVNVSFEVIRGSLHADCPPRTRAAAIAGAFGYLAAEKARVVGRPVVNPLYRVWSRLALEAVARSDRSGAWPRALCCASGLWNRDPELLRLAASDLSKSRVRLQRFLGEKLKANLNARSAAILLDWLEGPDAQRREAAVVVLALPTHLLLEKLRTLMSADEVSAVVRRAQQMRSALPDDTAVGRPQGVAG